MTKRGTVFIGLTFGLALCGLGYFLSQFWTVPVAAGAVLFSWSWIAPQKKGLMLINGNDPGDKKMELPSVWNEKDIQQGLTRYQTDQSMLSSYVNGVVSRFVMGQDTRTMQTRIAFLEQFNKVSAIARESYKWKRYINGGRAETEEDTEDKKAEISLKRVEAELELVELDTNIKRQEKQLQIRRLQREMEDLDKPEVVLARVPKPPSESEIMAQKLHDLDERENRVIEQMQVTRAHPKLTEEQKQRKLNALEDTLGRIHEEQALLL